MAGPVRSSTALILVLASANASAQFFLPAGPDCANATAITQPLIGPAFGLGSFDLQGATLSGPVPSCDPGSGGDQWFAWTSSFGSDYAFSLFGVAAATLAVYDACGGNELGCVQGGGFVDPTLTLTGLSPNTTYWIQILSSFDDGCLDVIPQYPPFNDDCGNATALTGGTLYNDFATASGLPAPSCLPGMGTTDVWYTWTSGPATNYVIRTFGSSSFPHSISLYDACGGTELACHWSPTGIPPGTPVIGLTPNTTYLVRLEGLDGAFGLTNLDIDPLVPGPVGSIYCQLSVNSTGSHGTISGFGIPTISAASLELTASGLPPGVFGLFYYGTQQIDQPFGDGRRCVSGTTQRLPIRQVDASGTMVEANVFAAPLPNLALAPGTFHFQAYYRDSAAMMSGSNLTYGLSISFGP